MIADLRFAFRMILSHRWFSAAVVATLALGIGLNTMVFTLVYAVLLKPVPVPGGEHLVVISGRNLAQPQGSNTTGISYPDFRDLRAQTKSFSALEAATDAQGVLGEPGNPPQPFHLENTTTGIFEMLHIPPVLGRDFNAADGQPGAAPVLMLSYQVWKERYNLSPSVIGRAVRVNEKPATIVGVMPKDFKFPANTDLWMPLIPNADNEKRDNRSFFVFGMLRAGGKDASMITARTEVSGIASRLTAQYPTTNKNATAVVETFHERFNGGNIRTIFLLMLASVGFVLLIACANVANMMLSRALGRQREMSIRTALGASRWRMVRQLLIESILLSTFGGILGLGLAALGVHWFDLATQNVGKPYWIQFSMDYSALAYFAGLCVLSGLLFGIAPALRSSKVSPNDVLKDGGRSVGRQRGGLFAAALVVFQLALTLVLLTGAGVFVHSILENLEANRSVPANQLLVARIDFPEERYKDTDAKQHFYDQLLPRVRALPGVQHVALTSSLPGLGSADSDVEMEHSAPVIHGNRPQISYIVQSPGYLATIHLPLLMGRDFDERDGTDNHKAAILTRQCAAHFWPGQNPIGKRFRFYDDKGKPGDWITVVGVSADMVGNLNEKSPNPLLFVPFRQMGWNGMAVVVDSSIDPTSALRSAVQDLDQDLPLRDVELLTAAIDHQEWFLRVFVRLFGGFALIALVMASVGLYAVIAHATASRTQEIGVRMALGANTGNILRLIMRRGLIQIAIGLTLGIVAALPMMKAMTSLPIGVSPSDPTVFIAVAVVLASVGLFACWLPAHRAAHLDPVKAIRYE